MHIIYIHVYIQYIYIYICVYHIHQKTSPCKILLAGCVLFKYVEVVWDFCPQENRRQTIECPLFVVERALFGVERRLFCVGFGVAKQVRPGKIYFLWEGMWYKIHQEMGKLEQIHKIQKNRLSNKNILCYNGPNYYVPWILFWNICIILLMCS